MRQEPLFDAFDIVRGIVSRAAINMEDRWFDLEFLNRLEVIRRTDHGQHEQLRRVNRSATEENTAPGLHLTDSTLVQVGHAGDAFLLDQESGDAHW